MKQTKFMSLAESIINIVVGFGIACVAQGIFLPLLGVPIPWTANFIFAGIMTAISIARSYALRRLFEALHIRRPLSPFMQAVIAERFRQIEVEGWTLQHDDLQHDPGDLARAGGCYAIFASYDPSENWLPDRRPPAQWPWDRDWWKPTGFRRDLVKAGALIIAEGEKLDRNRKPRRREPPARGAQVVQLAHGKTPSEHGGAGA